MNQQSSLRAYTPSQIRNGIFALNTRRFGTVTEYLIKILANADWGKDISHDLFDEKQKQRIEVKFSRALRKHKATIQSQNILDEIVSADNAERMFASSEWRLHKFDCNIQQIKKKQFDILYYGIFFSDKVQIFKITPDQIGRNISYSDKQHFGNKGEGQFHLNNATYDYHLKNFFEAELTYEALLKLLLKLQDSGKLNPTVITLILSIFVRNATNQL